MVLKTDKSFHILGDPIPSIPLNQAMLLGDEYSSTDVGLERYADEGVTAAVQLTT